MKLAAATIVLCATLPGCAVQLYGNQSAGSGASATTTSSQVVASSSGSNARIGFSSGQRVASAAPGGQLSISGGSGSVAAVFLVGAVMLEFLNSPGDAPSPVKALPPAARIAHTCSCYGYTPPQAVAGAVMRRGDD